MGVVIAVVVFCGVLIAALTVHAMVIGNQQRLDGVLKVAWKVLIGFGLWAIAMHQWDKLRAVLRKTMHILKE
jgi:NADH:ubiquinone oxidoreductase subunit H